MAAKHHPRINPRTPPFQRFIVTALIAAIPLGLGLFMLSLFVRTTPALLAIALAAPTQLVWVLALLLLGVALLLLGVRLACKTTWKSEAFYQWVKPGGYHWRYRGRISPDEARDVRSLMRVPSWANRAGLSREVFAKTIEVTDPDTGYKSLKDVYEIIYPRFTGMALNDDGVRATIVMQDGHGSGVFAKQPGETRAVHREEVNARVWRVKGAAKLKHQLAIKGTHFQLLSRTPGQAVPSPAPASSALPHTTAPTQALSSPTSHPLPDVAVSPSSGIYDYKREVLREQYQDAYPVRNWLLYKLTGQDCDKIALADELARVQAAGFAASPDSMHSFWTTYKQAIKIWYGDVFTLGHPTNNVQRLLELHDAGAYAEVNQLFAPFAALAHARGNFILMPVYNDPQTGRPSRDTNLNLVRNKTKSDYWDLTLAGIKSGEFNAFFGSNPVAEQFNIAAMPGGFNEYIARNHLEAYIGADGEVAPLWAGHLNPGAKYLPQRKEDVAAFVANACAAITRRTHVLSGQ